MCASAGSGKEQTVLTMLTVLPQLIALSLLARYLSGRSRCPDQEREIVLAYPVTIDKGIAGAFGCRDMTQSAIHITYILLICGCAATPALAQPPGGGHVSGGGGVRAFAAPHFSAPHSSGPLVAPRVLTPSVSSPRISVPSITHAPMPATTRVAPAPFSAPAHASQSNLISGRTGSAPSFSRAVPHVVTVP